MSKPLMALLAALGSAAAFGVAAGLLFGLAGVLGVLGVVLALAAVDLGRRAT